MNCADLFEYAKKNCLDIEYEELLKFLNHSKSCKNSICALLSYHFICNRNEFTQKEVDNAWEDYKRKKISQIVNQKKS